MTEYLYRYIEKKEPQIGGTLEVRLSIDPSSYNDEILEVVVELVVAKTGEILFASDGFSFEDALDSLDSHCFMILKVGEPIGG